MFINGRERITASEVASFLGEDPVLLYGQFLDDYKRASIEDKILLIQDAPIQTADRPVHYEALLAAVCESLAKQDGIPIPEWVYEQRYYLKEPVFAFNTTIPGHREYLLETTPEEFLSRNVIFGDNVMSRC